MADLNTVTSELQDLRKDMIGANEVKKEREERIKKQKNEMSSLKSAFDELEIKYNSMVITQNKTQDSLVQTEKDLKDTVKKLHETDKNRHDTEIRLLEEINKSKELSETVKTKDDSVLIKERQIEEMDKKNLDLMRQNE